MPNRYSTGALLTVATGKVVSATVQDGRGGASEVVREVGLLFGDLLGWSPMSQQLNQQALWDGAGAVLREQHPWAFEYPIPDFPDVEAVRAYVQRVDAVHGTHHDVEPVTSPTTPPQHPFAGFPDGADIIPVVL